jgi:hypothetical protein
MKDKQPPKRSTDLEAGASIPKMQKEVQRGSSIPGIPKTPKPPVQTGASVPQIPKSSSGSQSSSKGSDNEKKNGK